MTDGHVAAIRRSRRLLALAAFACALAALPAGAAARTDLLRAGHGGTVIGTSGGSGASTTTPSATNLPRDPVIRLATALTASGDGITITVAGSGTTKHPLTVTGTAPATAAGSKIEIEKAPQSPGNRWSRVATALINPGGGFTAVWVPSNSGQAEIRAVVADGSTTATVQAETGENGGGAAPDSDATTTRTTSTLTVTIFKSAIATMYGPGFWGRHTACGQRLRKATLGVASRTLKCGTKVEIDFRGREITVPVIDRGPFTANASWDLTFATAEALGITQPSAIGTLT